MKCKLKADGTGEGWSLIDQDGKPIPLDVRAATVELLPGLPPLAKLEVMIQVVELDRTVGQLYTTINGDRYRLTLEE